MHLYFKKLRSHPQPGPSRARISPPLGSSPWVLFYLFPSVGASQAREFQIAKTTTPRKTVQTTFCTVICIFFHKILQIPCFLKCVCMFLQCFPSKHGNLHICRHKTAPKHYVLQCFQFPCLPKPLKTPLFTLSPSIFHVPMPLANSNIYTKSPSKTLFPTCQVRVVRFYQSCRLLLPPPPPPPPSPRLLLPPDLNYSHPRQVLAAGPQPRPSQPSVGCRTPTTASPAQCWLPDLNHGHPGAVLAAGPQPRPSRRSVRCRTSTTTSLAQCSLPDLNHHQPRPVFAAGPQLLCQKLCQIECQKLCQIECQKLCQIECQKLCQIECQIE